MSMSIVFKANLPEIKWLIATHHVLWLSFHSHIMYTIIILLIELLFDVLLLKWCIKISAYACQIYIFSIRVSDLNMRNSQNGCLRRCLYTLSKHVHIWMFPSAKTLLCYHSMSWHYKRTASTIACCPWGFQTVESIAELWCVGCSSVVFCNLITPNNINIAECAKVYYEKS